MILKTRDHYHRIRYKHYNDSEEITLPELSTFVDAYLMTDDGKTIEHIVVSKESFDLIITEGKLVDDVMRDVIEKTDFSVGDIMSFLEEYNSDDFEDYLYCAEWYRN